MIYGCREERQSINRIFCFPRLNEFLAVFLLMNIEKISCEKTGKLLTFYILCNNYRLTMVLLSISHLYINIYPKDDVKKSGKYSLNSLKLLLIIIK